MSRKRSFSKALCGRNDGPPPGNSRNGQNINRRQNRSQREIGKGQETNSTICNDRNPRSTIPLPPPPLPHIFQIQLEPESSPIVFGPPTPPPMPDANALERIPAKGQTPQNGKQSGNQGSSQNKSYATAVKQADKETTSTLTEDEDPRLLLSQVYDKDSEDGSEAQNIDIFEQSLFMRELILSLPVESDAAGSSDLSPVSETTPVTARAIPVDCGILSATSSEQATASEDWQSDFKQNGSKAEDVNVYLGDRTVGLDNQASMENVAFSKESASEHAARGTDMSLSPPRKSNSEEKSPIHQQLGNMTGLKKESSNNVRQSQYSSGASSVAGIVRTQSSHPVSTFPVLVSGATEQ